MYIYILSVCGCRPQLIITPHSHRVKCSVTHSNFIPLKCGHSVSKAQGFNHLGYFIKIR